MLLISILFTAVTMVNFHVTAAIMNGEIMEIIGRESEQELLRGYYETNEPEFLVVSGRRRVGKTFLIREFFDDDFCFFVTGLAKGSKSEQLANFNKALNEYGKKEFPVAGDWLDAFAQLKSLVQTSNIRGKKVIFLDEMPWMDTHRSGFITGLEAFWNGWASGRPDILLIVCGSAAAWVSKKLFKNTGGLYNRVTQRMLIKPFTLGECERYFNARGIVYSRLQMVESHMIFGGIPFYLRQMRKELSFTQNVDRLCFADDAPLKNEFYEMYHSLFKRPQHYIRVVEAINSLGRGLSRDEIANATKLSGGGLSAILNDLELSGFIRRYQSYGKIERDSLYQLVDPFSLFFLRFMRGVGIAHDKDFWTNTENTGERNSWKGYAFERVCLAHVAQIKRKLGISGVSTNVYSWLKADGDPRFQIDLVIERRDGVFNICEMKYSIKEYELAESYSEKLRKRLWAFSDIVGENKAVHTTFITTYGLKHNKYWAELVQSEVIMADLFA
jgi:AAA+ ATPase superfamily predicted ATPase